MLNFKDLDKKILPITFADGKEISVLPPTKASYEKMYSATSTKTTEAMYELTAELLSRNVENETITVEYLDVTLDVSDIMIVIRAYKEFVNEVISNPN